LLTHTCISFFLLRIQGLKKEIALLKAEIETQRKGFEESEFLLLVLPCPPLPDRFFLLRFLLSSHPQGEKRGCGEGKEGSGAPGFRQPEQREVLRVRVADLLPQEGDRPPEAEGKPGLQLAEAERVQHLLSPVKEGG